MRGRRLLNSLQKGLPISTRPFRELGRKCGLAEESALRRVKAMKSSGLIRRLGGVFASDKLGYATTLVGFKVKPGKTEGVARAVARRSEVTHCYQRKDEYNLWFTLHAVGRRRLLLLFKELSRLPGVVDALELPALEVFKVDVNLKV